MTIVKLGTLVSLLLKTVDKKDAGVPHIDIVPMVLVKAVIRTHLFQGDIIQLLEGCVW